MQQALDSPFDGHCLFQNPRKRLNKMVDPTAVQPWQKTTIEISTKQLRQNKKFQTFYQSPTFRQVGSKLDRNYVTQRVFSFQKQQQYCRKALSKQKEHEKLTIISQKSAITHYNINGSFLTEIVSPPKHKSSHKFFVRRPKEKQVKEKPRQCDETYATLLTQNIQSIKRRVNFSKQISTFEDSKFIRLNTENQDKSSPNHQQNISLLKGRKKAKVISLGFQKFSALRGTPKHKNINLSFLVL